MMATGKATGLIALLLAVVFAGVWVRSERQSGHVSEQPGARSTQVEEGSVPSAGGGATFQSPGRVTGKTPSDRHQLDQKLAQNEQELSTAQNHLNQVQDEIQSSDLDHRIQQQQQAVIDLQARSKVTGGQSASQLQNQAILANQDDQLLQQRVTGLQQQIQNQQAVSNSIEQQIRNTVAPEDSDLFVKLNGELDASERQKQKLVADYESVLQQQQQLAMNRYAAQAQAQQQQQAGAVSTDVALEQARGQLEDLNRQKQLLLNDAEQSRRRIEELQIERTSLMDQSQ